MTGRPIRNHLTADTWSSSLRRAAALVDTARAMHVHGLPGRQDALDAAVRALLQAALTARVLAVVAVLADDGQRDTLTEQEVELLRAADYSEPPVFVREATQALGDVVADLVGSLVRDHVLGAVVQNGGAGHVSPAVGRHGLEPVASAGSSAGVSATGDPTVGAPAGTPACSPCTAGVSADTGSTDRVTHLINGRMTQLIETAEADPITLALGRAARDALSRAHTTSDGLWEDVAQSVMDAASTAGWHR